MLSFPNNLERIAYRMIYLCLLAASDNHPFGFALEVIALLYCTTSITTPQEHVNRLRGWTPSLYHTCQTFINLRR